MLESLILLLAVFGFLVFGMLMLVSWRRNVQYRSGFPVDDPEVLRAVIALLSDFEGDDGEVGHHQAFRPDHRPEGPQSAHEL